VGERRIVTVVFADISGFTAMSEHMDPEQVRNLMNMCFDQLVPVIEKYEGAVDKFIGDEIMALFGAPVAHEDDPVRALHAVIEMTETLNAFNQEFATDLGLHAGINTGLVVAGGIGSEGRQEYSVMGDTVNVAARLRAESERGEILVGADTYRLTKPIFEFDRLEPVEVKGKIEPVSAFRLADVKTNPESLRGLAGLESEMIGRESEFETLIRMTEAVKAGLGRSVLILGEPGLGKSRLITEWLSELDQDSSASEDASTVQWAIGHCLSYGHGQAYHLLLDLLRSLIDVPTTLDEREKSTILKSFTEDLLGSTSDEVYPYLGHLLSIPLDGEAREKVSSLDPSDLQALYMVSIRRLLLAIAEREPLILICEDIHWADPSSIEILLKLLPVINESRVIFCFTTRPERETPGWKLVTTMREEFGPGLEEIELHSLTDDDSRQLISNLLQFEAIPGQVRSLILERAEGNPLYVEEVIGMLVDRKYLVREDGLWNARADIDSVDIPDTLHGLLLARIDRLPDDVRHTLRVASVVGRQFSVRVLEDVLLNI
jgi:class 3 adenylate cyclase